MRSSRLSFVALALTTCTAGSQVVPEIEVAPMPGASVEMRPVVERELSAAFLRFGSRIGTYESCTCRAQVEARNQGRATGVADAINPPLMEVSVRVRLVCPEGPTRDAEASAWAVGGAAPAGALTNAERGPYRRAIAEATRQAVVALIERD